MGTSLNSLSRFSENLRKSSYKIENSGNIWKLWVFLTTISHMCGAIKLPSGAAINKCFSESTFPDDLKCAEIVPVSKT